MTQAQSKSYGGVKKKLMGAICMLLVASIMVVSSTYAWFTLSTAPEITGISTSVGANGNLEMALLNGSENGAADTDTYADLTKIKSAVGDSKYVDGKDVKEANITWGNLVDLTTGYGLDQIKLMPAAVKYAEGGTTNLDKASMLATAQYGADGRVKDVEGTTVSAVYNDGFKYSNTQSYGVRAVGVSSNVTARQAAFNSAKNSYRISVANTQRAVNDNSAAFMSIAMGLLSDGGSVDYNLDKSQINGMIAIANGMLKDFYGMDIAMKNAILAQAAQNKEGVNGDQFKAIQTALAEVKTAAELDAQLKVAATFVSGSIPEGVTAYVADAVAAEKTLTDTITALQGALPEDDVSKADVKTHIEALLGTNLPHETFRTPVPIKVYMTGGVLGKLAEYNGTFLLTAVVGTAQAYAGYGQKATGTDEGAADSWKDTEAKLAAVTTAVKDMTYTEGTVADTTITDTYGYVLDMAFRTNAAESYLKLQTAAAQRIYQEGSTNADTQGSGSNITFTYGEGAEAVTADQATKLLQAVRVVFFNPENGSIYATAKLSTPNMTTANQAKADLVVDTPEGGKADKIVDMTQNQATKVSILVYLDGANIDNAAVSNGSKTGTAMKLNLQFSSSADLVPMENSALKNGTGVQP